MNEDHIKSDKEKNTNDSARHLSVRSLPLKTFFRSLISITLLILAVYYFMNYVAIQNKWARVGLWLRNQTETISDQSHWNNLGTQMKNFANEFKNTSKSSITMINANCFEIASKNERNRNARALWSMGGDQEWDPIVNYNFSTYLQPLTTREIDESQISCENNGNLNNESRHSIDIQRAGLVLSKFESEFFKKDLKIPDTLMDHSDRMLQLFKIKDFIHKSYPELRLLWFYVGTSNGAFASFPGHDISGDFNPTKRPWYKSAAGDAGFRAQSIATNCGDKCGLSSPYIDALSGMPIRTFWYKIDDAGLTDVDMAVIGLDFMVQISGTTSYRHYIAEALLILLLGLLVVYGGFWLIYQQTDAFFKVAIQKISSVESWKAGYQVARDFIRRKV